AGIGVLAGGVLAVGNFRWLVVRAAAATAAGVAPPAAWLLGAALRFLACAAACAGLLAAGWGHPLGLVVGFAVLPCAPVARRVAAGGLPLVSLPRRARARAAPVPDAFHGAGAVVPPGPDVRDRADQPPGPAAIADTAAIRQHAGRTYPAGDDVLPDGAERA